jgi:glycosyltransferase involved in cell wall biosynthesis
MKRSLVTSGFDGARIVVTPTVTEVRPEPPDDYPISGSPRVLYVGQLTEFKGLAVLIDAVAQNNDVELDIVGAGAFEALLTQQVKRKRLGDRITFHGVLPREKIEPLMRRACCAVVPSIYPEPFGLVGPEAMAAARPVIGSNIGGIPEWLDDGVCGYLVPPNDPRELARRIADVVGDRSRSRQMGLAGRRRWEERFHPRQHVATLLDVYNTIIRSFKTAPVAL